MRELETAVSVLFGRIWEASWQALVLAVLVLVTQWVLRRRALTSDP
jgi:hypothetical protein